MDRADGIPSHVQKLINETCLKLKRRELIGGHTVAKRTAEVLRTVAGESRWDSPQALVVLIKKVGKRLADAQPIALVIGNVVRRFLKLVQYEAQTNEFEEEARTPLSPQSGKKDFSGEASPSLKQFFNNINVNVALERVTNIKQEVMSSIQELMTEIEDSYTYIAEQATDHIHADEVILTVGNSTTVEKFLLHAKKKHRKFMVIVAEGAPRCEGHAVAMRLSQLGIETTLITDSAIFAMMARVSKVIVSCHAVMANGGLLSLSGGHMLALAAKHHSVPFLVLTGIYKLTPLFPFNQDTFNLMLNPGDLLGFEDAEALEHAVVQNPGFDYIPPELVTLLITNRDDGQSPSYVYRMLKEYYRIEDYNLDEDQSLVFPTR